MSRNLDAHKPCFVQEKRRNASQLARSLTPVSCQAGKQKKKKVEKEQSMQTFFNIQ
jgi:hypothetical protein